MLHRFVDERIIADASNELRINTEKSAYRKFEPRADDANGKLTHFPLFFPQQNQRSGPQ